ncbi:membrane peptidoglycan carboxypeptidase [Arcanobacterium hippocoleae]|uniref:Membrane peptidoglycan carboxypeptidase n=1 Tax=Arcanobacterium hippocoleae TaxID=149017 RepID=A0ABU1T1V9_9ACTO|nr:membrane peptidoglycan carboxypeptidase [Arcanobacterium hippocoleae]
MFSLAGGLALAGAILPVAASAGTASNAVMKLFDDLPTSIDFTKPSEQSSIRAADGTVLANFYAENRIVVASDQISQHLKNAAVAIEDERFFEHAGIDAKGILGAAFNNFTGGALAGGSTITQQYVKNSLIEEGRLANDNEQIKAATETSIGRKLNEARYALAIEKQMSKDEILTAYLNIAQFGPSQWGVESASRFFFSKPAKDVTIAEAAMIAGNTQAPNRWNPLTDPEATQHRRDSVLGKMKQLGYISQEEYDAAIATNVKDLLKISPASNGCAMAGNAAYFCETVISDILASDSWGKNRADRIQKLYRGGLDIITTLDLQAQNSAYAALVSEVPVADPSDVDAATSIVEPGTGKVLAMAQNTDFGKPSKEHPDYTQVNANVDEGRGGGIGYQPGSTFKVFTLAEWIRTGHSPNQLVNTNPRRFTAKDFHISCAPEMNISTWEPQNSFNRRAGMQTVTENTVQSYNIGFLEMAGDLDLCNMTKLAGAMGAHQGTVGTEKNIKGLEKLDAKVGKPLPVRPNPATIIGGDPVTPLSMANAAATFAAEGKACKPITFTEIKDKSGKVLSKQEPDCKQVLPEEAARTANLVMQHVVTRGGGSRAAIPGRNVAGKTGTSNDSTNTWFFGLTPNMGAAVWVGHLDAVKPMQNITINGVYYRELFGEAIAARIFRKAGQGALKDKPVMRFKAPRGRVLLHTQSEEEKKREAEEEARKKREAEEAGQHKIPNVSGVEMNSAARILRERGYAVVAAGVWSNAPKNTVVSTEPAAGTVLAPGGRITLNISAGPAPY